MPELPEVETIKRELNNVLLGLVVESITVRTLKMFYGNPKDLIGGEIESVERVGKIIKIKNQKSNIKNTKQKAKILLIHLKLTGRLIFNKEEYEKNKHTHIIIEFKNNKKLYFWDLRKFGWMRVISQKSKVKSPKLNLGPDALSRDFNLAYFKKILENWGRPVKILLMEQVKIAGIGNIYANEALFCAEIAPHHRGRDLIRDHPKKVKALYKCIQKVLKKGIKYKGASDDSFRLINGAKGKMQSYFKVYKRTGKPCPNDCGKVIRRMKINGRGTFFCPRCQR